MLRGMYSSISAMINLQEKQSVITSNLANMNTIGYKSESLISKSFDEVILSNKDKYINGDGRNQTLGSLSLGVKIDDNITNFSQGTLVETNNQTDVAIDGRGFFTIRDSAGKEFYSRDGAFKVNSQGYLVTSAGHFVLGNNINGNKEPIYVGNRDININNQGEVFLDSNLSYKILISDFNDYNSLNKVGDNLYSSSENPSIGNTYSIKAGFKEGSNVDMIEQSTLLMTNLRAFEANQKVVQVMDSTLNKIANEIGSIR